MTDKKKKDAVAVISEETFPMLAADAVGTVSELLSQVGKFDLLTLSVPAGGGLMWELPGFGGEVTGAPTVDVVICVLLGKQRKYWVEGFGEGAKGPPDCSSSGDGNGRGKPGGVCRECPHDQFRDEGKPGKDCQEFAIAYLFREGGRMPMMLSIPERSLKNMKQYLMGLADMGVGISSVVTRLGLEKALSGGGIAYSKVTFAAVSKVEGTGEMKAVVEEFAAKN